MSIQKQHWRAKSSAQASGWRVGDEVNYHARKGGPVTTSGHIIKEIGSLGHGQWVAWITGKSGCVALDCLSRANAKGDAPL